MYSKFSLGMGPPLWVREYILFLRCRSCILGFRIPAQSDSRQQLRPRRRLPLVMLILPRSARRAVAVSFPLEHWMEHGSHYIRCGEGMSSCFLTDGLKRVTSGRCDILGTDSPSAIPGRVAATSASVMSGETTAPKKKGGFLQGDTEGASEKYASGQKLRDNA